MSLRILLAILLAAGCAFPALGLSGTAPEYIYDGSHLTAASPLCAMNPGGLPVTAAVRSGDPCVRASFNGANETVLAPGGEACIALEPLCGNLSRSVSITAFSVGGAVSTGVSRTVKITTPIQPRANASQPAAGNATNGTAGNPVPSDGSPPVYATVLILAVVIVLVSAWHLTKYHSRS